MIEGECKVGQIVKVTQPTNEKGKTGKIIAQYDWKAPIYFIIEGFVHKYQASQLELISESDEVINEYQIY